MYSWKAHKILAEECRNKISSIRTKTHNVVDESLKTDFSPTNTACILTKHSYRTNNTPFKVSRLSAKSANNEKKNKEPHTKDEAPAEKTHTNFRRGKEEHAIEIRESDTRLEEDIKQSKTEKAASLMMICKVCNKKFRSRKSYWAHVRMHSGEKSYICHICGKQYFQNGSLYYHLKHMHDGVKNHACDICGRSFAMKTAMEDHRRIHTGERPYVCDSCGKTFKTKASLYIHNKTHTDELPHECFYCSKRFRWKQRMLGHLTMHTGEKNHTCDVCGKGFGVKNDLTRHKRIHSDEKPYTCQQCGISFSQKRYLRNHERSKLGMCGHLQSSSHV